MIKILKFKVQITCLIAIMSSTVYSSPFDLKIESIKDSTSLLEKINQPDDPLYVYFSKFKSHFSLSDVLNTINHKVISNIDFAYNVTHDERFRNNEKFENMSTEMQEEIMAKNRDLLTEIYQDEIMPRNKELLKQEISLKCPLESQDSLGYLKAEVVNFINEILSNERLLDDWEYFRRFFIADVTDEEVESFAISMKKYVHKRVPINKINIQGSSKENKVKIIFSTKNENIERNLLTISTSPGKKWRISNMQNFITTLLQTGYMEEKRSVNGKM